MAGRDNVVGRRRRHRGGGGSTLGTLAFLFRALFRLPSDDAQLGVMRALSSLNDARAVWENYDAFVASVVEQYRAAYTA